VRTPKGFKEAYKAYCEAGWNRLGVPEAFGGAGLPIILTFAVAEMGSSSNQAFAMYPGLTSAAYSALLATGAPWMREHVAKRMIEGEWTGTMCLTEPHCGTDLRLMKRRRSNSRTVPIVFPARRSSYLAAITTSPTTSFIW